ncbi:MAG TPA: succinylglutamate desuccinylase/aspartoacylase family protein [Myxococcota bacterium]|nr:succinylglutamate desuccinylase/aspartoacylase family protein [Myxococcota bacterium]
MLAAPAPALAMPSATASVTWDEIEILSVRVATGEARRLMLRTSESFAGSSIDTPVHVLHGSTPGPTVCFVAGVHGDELNGVEIVRQIFEELEPSEVSGTVLALPVANLHGFRQSSRYLPDRRDLNRYFPGNPAGSSASRIADALFHEVIARCGILVDFHTGSFHRSNVPQVRANLRDDRVRALALEFGVEWVVHSEGRPGTLRRAAVDAGIPALTYEAGEPLRFQEREIARGIAGARQLLSELKMIEGKRNVAKPTLILGSTWIRADEGGIFQPSRDLGDRVDVGEMLGTVTDPITNERSAIIAPRDGRILGMALPQVVIPGFAVFHLGFEGAKVPSPEEDATAPEPEPLEPYDPE